MNIKKMADLSPSERLNRILENEGITIYRLSQLLDLASTTGLYNIQKGAIKNITQDMSQRIKNAFPHYRTAWLRIGEGEMLEPEAAKDKKEPIDSFDADNFDVVAKQSDLTVKEKIQQYLDFKGINNNKFETSIGASSSYWRNTKSISADILCNIFRVYSDINIEWVLLDKGEMIKKETAPIASSPESVGQISSERLLLVIESQQRTIEKQSATIEHLASK